MNSQINVLGTIYNIIFKSEEEVAKDMNDDVGVYGGYCNGYIKIIVISNFDKCKDSKEVIKELQNENLRHEIIHAFLNESGLKENSSIAGSWARNEEMVDWFAIQSPKIHKVFEELGCL